MSILTWLKSWFGSGKSSIAKQITSLADSAAPVIEEIERVKQKYKEAEDLNRKNGVVLEYVIKNERDINVAVKVANQLIYCPAAALWTELAVLGLKSIYPQATGYYLRCAITLAYAYFASQKPESQPEKQAEVVN